MRLSRFITKIAAWASLCAAESFYRNWSISGKWRVLVSLRHCFLFIPFCFFGLLQKMILLCRAFVATLLYKNIYVASFNLKFFRLNHITVYNTSVLQVVNIKRSLIMQPLQVEASRKRRNTMNRVQHTIATATTHDLFWLITGNCLFHLSSANATNSIHRPRSYYYCWNYWNLKKNPSLHTYI